MTKLWSIIVCTLVLCTHSALSLWDFAVTTNSKILFFDKQWNEITSAAHQFEELSAITFDEAEETVYFNDQLHNNGSIFSLKIPTTQDDPHAIEKIVQRTQKESIAGIAFDPISQNIYWSDGENKKIYFSSVNAAETDKPKVLLDFANEESKPEGIAIDICRRKLYWTNANFKNASIECINLDGGEREKIVHMDIFLPHGIVVDQLSDRIFWVDDKQGSHFTVESANLDGTDRQIIIKGLDNVPFSLAVIKDKIFWTDWTNNAVWSHSKIAKIHLDNETISDAENAPQKMKVFAEQPRGIVARTRYLQTLQNDQHCSDVVKKIKTRLFSPKPTVSAYDTRMDKLKREYCLNGGRYVEQSGLCLCKIGFDGARCEIEECHNYCVHGTCSMSSTGFPKCTCQQGFNGERCQSYKCNGYCFNEGRCQIDEYSNEPSCECKDNFGGLRCEQNSTEICSLFCRLLKHEPDMYVPFGCHDICEQLSQQSEDGVDIYAIPKYKHLEVCQNTNSWDTPLIVLICGVVACLVLVLMIVHGLRRFYKPARPRIKKTFVVKKHTSTDTPLTNRPIATEQCEITIENCCNMNICETPCFDPKLLQKNMTRDANAKEDKKILIHNMEDDLY